MEYGSGTAAAREGLFGAHRILNATSQSGTSVVSHIFERREGRSSFAEIPHGPWRNVRQNLDSPRIGPCVQGDFAFVIFPLMVRLTTLAMRRTPESEGQGQCRQLYFD